MTSRCLASSLKSFSVGRFRASPGNFIYPLASGPHAVPHIQLSSALSPGCSNHQMKPALQLNPARPFHSSCCLEAGHSKWKNIKHIKEAADRDKGMKSNLLSRKIKIVLDRTPEPDPKLNTELANLIKWARANNLTNEVVNKAIDRQMQLRDPKNITSFGGRGPSNTGIMIECFSLKPVHTKGILQSYVKKHGFNLNTPVDDIFDHKGVVDVELSKEELVTAKSNPDSFSLDKYVDVAINSGAEDVLLETDDDEEEPFLRFLCDPLLVSRVSKALGEAELNVINSEKTYLPKIVVPVSQEFIENLNKLMTKLDTTPEVVKYYFNVQPES
jgi:translational activator of cytochrome c oxidase 1